VAKEMGAGFRSTSGPVLSKAGDLAAILTSLQANDVLFIDEIHRLSVSVEELLYSAMEDFSLDIMIGEGPSAKTIKIDLPPFTLIGATTRVGLLTSPLQDRFGINLVLNFYDNEELKDIIVRASKVLNFDIATDGAYEIAKRARGTPRIALRLLRRVIDFAIVGGKEEIDKKIADYSLNRLEIDHRGLDKQDKKYLTFIAEHFLGGPVGIETIASGIAEERDTVEENIEPYLIQSGFINRTSRGRVLTKTAYEHLGIARPSRLSDQENLF
jgi:Holliday junction DNA helicase RuvB